MMNVKILFATLLLSIVGFCQSPETKKLNLDFEEHKGDYPINWENFGNKKYKIYTDSVNVKNGKYSVVIESDANAGGFKALAFNLPSNYIGRQIRLSGFIKTENVTDGFAGLWVRIDPDVAFDNMAAKNINGTTDWQEYEIILPLKHEKTKNIVVGGLLVGKGKMWLDNLKVTVDGKDLDSKYLESYVRQIMPAEKDKEFDKGSNIVFSDLNSEKINNLELLGKIWGFVKYHHPEVGKGNYNWDYELFRFLPTYLNATNAEERDNLLNNWIDKYGKVAVCENCKATPRDAVLKPDLSWIDNSKLSQNLKLKLKEVYNGRYQGVNYYISLHEGVGNPDFTNENPYVNMPYPDAGFRLLSLYRYWNMINYFFPSKHLADKKWEAVLKEYIPKFLEAKDELTYELAALQLIGEINDTHAGLAIGNDKILEFRGNNYAPFRVEFVENKLVVTDYFNPELIKETGLKIGDIITHIDHKSIETIIDSLKSYYPSSNKSAMLRDISMDLLRSSKNKVHLNYISNKQSKQKEITLYDRKQLNMYYWYKVDENQPCFKLLDGNIGYITLANIKKDDIDEIKKTFKKTKGIIIDIRNYPTTFVPFALGSYFMSKPTSFVKFTKGNPDNPGEFTFMEGPKIESDGNRYKGKLVVLVNENSQSQAEYTSMAFRAVKNSLIVGGTTAGADGNVSEIYLPGNLKTWISGVGVYYPDGKETQRVGIVPDIIIERTIDGVIKGKDEVLEKAVQILNGL